MQGKNYTNPMDRGRFGFSRSGEFRVPLKAEGILVVIVVLVAAALGVAVFIVGSSIVKKNDEVNHNETTFAAGMTIFVCAVVVLIIIIFMVVAIRLIKKGMLCKYTANDDTFTATIGGDLHVININEVQGISFAARSSFGKVRGYNITIRIRGVEEKYSICSEGYLSPRATPFYIIQERLNAAQHASHMNNFAEPSSFRSSSGSSNAISKAEAERARTGSMSAMDRMAQLLGENSDMPELSVPTVDDYFVTPSHEQRPDAENRESSSNMLEVGQTARYAPAAMVTTGQRDHTARSAVTQGTFYVEPTIPALILKILIFLVAWAAIVLGLLYAAENFFGLHMEDVQRKLIIFGGLAPSELILLVYLIIKTHGPLHSYKSDGRGLFITPKGKPEEKLLYKDIISIDYKLTKLCGTARGYKVEIMTKSGIVKYNYMFPLFNTKVAKQYLPFEPIRKNLEERAQENSEQPY